MGDLNSRPFSSWLAWGPLFLVLVSFPSHSHNLPPTPTLAMSSLSSPPDLLPPPSSASCSLPPGRLDIRRVMDLGAGTFHSQANPGINSWTQGRPTGYSTCQG